MLGNLEIVEKAMKRVCLRRERKQMIDDDENKTYNMIIARYYTTMCLDHKQTTHSALE